MLVTYLELNECLRQAQLQKLKDLNIQAVTDDSAALQAERQECLRLMDYYDRIIWNLGA